MRILGRQGKTRKGDLAAILQEAVRNNVPVYAENISANGDEAPAIEDGFGHAARWRTLQPLDDVLEEPTADGFRPPTQPEEQTVKNERRNFAEVFDRPCFKEMSPEWRLTKSKKNSRVVMDGRGKPRYFSTVRQKGRAKVSWLEKHGLNATSEPWEYVESLMRTDTTGVDKTTLFDRWTA